TSNFTPLTQDMNVQSDFVKELSFHTRYNDFDVYEFNNNETGQIFVTWNTTNIPWNITNRIILSNGVSGSTTSFVSQYLREVGQ
ncbi:2840_t:CDS:2, partial [Racocetra persica]